MTRRTNAAASVVLVVLAIYIPLLLLVVLTNNLQVIAGLWTIGTILGIVDTAGTLRDTIVERRAAGNDDILSNIANGNIRREVFRLIELLALLLVGIIALTGTTATFPSRLAILSVVILLVLNARLDRRERHDTDHLIILARDLHRHKHQEMENESV